MSHGRGGAGNINSKPNANAGADDLSTPVIKSAQYTTGRGGTGNIVSNDNAENARKAQDVDAPSHHQKEAKGTYHWGRGGEGNMVTIGQSEGERNKSKERTGRKPSLGGEGRRSGSFKGALDKGREMLGLGGKGKDAKVNESAVVDDVEQK